MTAEPDSELYFRALPPPKKPYSQLPTTLFTSGHTLATPTSIPGDAAASTAALRNSYVAPLTHLSPFLMSLSGAHCTKLYITTESAKTTQQ